MNAVTEKMNSLTLTWDNLSITEQLDILRQCDCQMFDALLQPESLQQILDVITLVRSYSKGVTVVMGGSGTSGRLAYLTSCRFGQHAGVSPRYLIAGGDAAITKSAESSEDQCDVAVRDLQKLLGSLGQSSVIYIGVSCGMSAPYVAAQLDYCQRYTIPTVVLGFNPIELARSHIIEGVDFSFQDVAKKASFLINPVVGPEPITGSSRMKGGSATLIILDIIFTFAQREQADTPCVDDLQTAIRLFQQTAVYDDSVLVPIIERAGKALNAGHSVRYLATEGSVGERFARLDASECPPTFGAAFEDIAANLEVSEGDCVIHIENLVKPSSIYEELKLKLWLNGISTLAHILKGKVLGNLMIDVKVSNVKLYARAISIVSHVAGVPEGQAEAALLRSIYDDAGSNNSSHSSHVSAAFHRRRVVPVAICLASGCPSLQRANELLDGSPKIREVLAQL